MQRWANMLMMALAASGYGLVTPLAKIAVARHLSIPLVTVYQYPVPLLLFLAAGLWQARAHPPHFSRREWTTILLVGAASAGTALSYYQALRFVPGWLGIVLLFQFAWMLPVVSWIHTRRPPSGKEWASIGVIVAGTLMAAHARGVGHLQWIGLVLGLLAGLSYALTLFWQGLLTSDHSPWWQSLVSTATAAIVVVLVYRPWSVSGPSAHPLSAFSWGTFMGLVGMAVPMVLIYVSAARLGGVLTAILASLELPVAMCLSAVWLHEPVQSTQWVGVLIMLAAIIYGTLQHRA